MNWFSLDFGQKQHSRDVTNLYEYEFDYWRETAQRRGRVPYGERLRLKWFGGASPYDFLIAPATIMELCSEKAKEAFLEAEIKGLKFAPCRLELSQGEINYWVILTPFEFSGICYRIRDHVFSEYYRYSLPVIAGLDDSVSDVFIGPYESGEQRTVYSEKVIDVIRSKGLSNAVPIPLDEITADGKFDQYRICEDAVRTEINHTA